MKERQTVVLFGDSLLMDSVEASLSNIQELGLVRIHSSVPNVVGRIGGLAPNMVIFDLNVPHTEFLIPFLKAQPGIPLLGLDVTRSQVIALSSQQYTTLTSGDLARVIKLQTMSRVEEVELVSTTLDELSQAYTSSVQRVGKDGNTRRRL